MSLEFEMPDGMAVITKDGKRLGSLKGAEVDTDNWTVRTIKIQVSKEVGQKLGIKKPLFGPLVLTMSRDVVGAVGDVVTLNVEMNGLRQRLL